MSATITIGNRYAKHMTEVMSDRGISDKNFTYGEVSAMEEMQIENMSDQDLLYVVVEGADITLEKILFIEKISCICKAFVIGVCIGAFPSSEYEYEHRFESATKAFYFPARKRIHNKIAIFAQMLQKALMPGNNMGFDINGLRACMNGKTNSLWYGKSFGKRKGHDMAYHFLTSDWYSSIPFHGGGNMVVIVNGDTTVYDVDNAVCLINRLMSAGSQMIISVVYDETMFDEMGMLVIGSQ